MSHTVSVKHITSLLDTTSMMVDRPESSYYNTGFACLRPRTETIPAVNQAGKGDFFLNMISDIVIVAVS